MKINTAYSSIFITTEIQTILSDIYKNIGNNKVFILVDENTRKYCLPKISSCELISNAEIIEIGSGEKNKSIETAINLWQQFKEKRANKSSLLINLGGGIICDLGGFAASTFKRGMHFLNIPTTLLSQVDASIGGKTGLNFGGLKNEIGVFSHPENVIIDSSFIRSLDKRNILSGWAEMIKHALIFDEKDWMNLSAQNINQIGFKELNQLIARSVNIKKYFVEKDPKEKDIRKALNFGHTIGHAFESLLMNSTENIFHGEAVAHGMICELYLSNKICKFPIEHINDIAAYLLSKYSKLKINTSEFDEIIDLIGHDKKNSEEQLNFTLLEDFGKIKINQNCDKKLIIEALNWYRKL
jgi:3-dehydroquinate synthase